jgi:hypothetical protein
VYALSRFVLLLAGCAPVEGPVTEGASDGGTWQVSLPEATFPAGESTLLLSVSDPSGGAVSGLDVLVVAGMDDMTHDPFAGWCNADEAGVYPCPAAFDMPGLWSVEGTLYEGDLFAGGRAESFHLVVEVL